ncbi:alpha/beta fold hydrolase [Methylobacterium dankookense]|uniref:AB hydrolase-1 domain-containing protein n=1 Tax=Methylobacterium dankookense TaxID=560405 RepID=A0A564FTX0_9HYPH|nr:alpha/beta hydrolase [Methylobacterium dankookense]GJD57234.1 hypothetical protein IFDJLNFL_3135 [Methylobacterium dankookense]VUF11523.1 hypothetical protein MTDSW087_01205 [Methylobacterium dankookense]
MAALRQETRNLDLAVGAFPCPTPIDLIGHGAPALLLPALSTISARAEMHGLAEELGGAYRCVVPDWPGFGDRTRPRLPLDPQTLHGFLDALLARLPGPYALGIGAGHAAGYLVAAARRHPGAFSRLVLVAPTWRGPLPTAMGPERRPLFGRIRRAVEAPLVGEALYRINISPPIIGRMMRAHVYAEAARVTPDLVRMKHAITRHRNGRFGTAAFVTGGLDPVETRDDFLALFGDGLPPIQVLRPERAPRRSGAEMDALAASGHVQVAPIPGALSPHEEYPASVAAAIRAG